MDCRFSCLVSRFETGKGGGGDGNGSEIEVEGC